MALIEYNIFGKIDKVQQAIDRYKAFEPRDGYYLAYSGGKDSVVINRLAEMAGVKFDAHYSITSVDPPELVRFIKNTPNVSMDFPRYSDGSVATMWNLIPRKKMLPTRLVRYCCAYLKETGGKGRVVVTGVRWAESARRKNDKDLVNIGNSKNTAIRFSDDNTEARREVEQCYRWKKTMLNPIIDWTDEDVWEFIRTENVPYCELYDCGFKRLGCIGCPMNTKAAEELERYPAYKRNYLRAIEKMLIERDKAGLKTNLGWSTPEKVMDWWLYGKQVDTHADMIGLDLDDI